MCRYRIEMATAHGSLAMTIISDRDDELILANGHRLRLRSVIPEDRERLADGFEHLSSESRFQRFHRIKLRLTPNELDYYTRCDGHNHLAVAAVTLHDGLEGYIVGVARAVRLPQEHDMAEMSIAVVDELHRQGIGQRLLQRLMMEAAPQHIRWLRAHVFADNMAIRGLLDRVAGDRQQCRREGNEMVIDFPNSYGTGHGQQREPAQSRSRQLENLCLG